MSSSVAPVAEGHAENYSEFRTEWRLLLAAMLGTGLGFPVLPFYSIGIFAPILTREFGWTFAAVLGGLSIAPFVLLLGGPLVGHLVDRLGARKVAAVSMVGLGIGYVSLAFSTGSLVQYYASWVVLSAAGVGATPISFTRAVNGAFAKRRGLALGIALAGTGLFAAAVKPLGSWLLTLADWRVAIIVIGALPLVIGATAVLWGLPTETGNSAGAQGKQSLGPELSLPGLTMREALRTRAYWIMVLAFLPMAFAVGGPLPNMENILRSAHIDSQTIVELTSLIGITLIAGRVVGGWLMDRVWAPLVGTVVLCAGAAACWALSQAVISDHRAILAVGLLGFAGGLEVDLLSYLVARYIGVRSYGLVYGTLFGLFSIGASFGPTVLALAYDRVGTYAGILTLCAMALVFSACVILGLGRYPTRLATTPSTVTSD